MFWLQQLYQNIIMSYVIVISLSTVEYTSVSRVYTTVDSDITYLIHGLVDCLERRLVVDGWLYVPSQAWRR